MLRHVDRLEEYFACLLLVALGLLLTVQIVLRYVFGIGYGWMEELARIGFVWVIFIGAVVGMRRGLHIRVTMGLMLFPESYRRRLEVAGDVVLFLFCAAFAWHGIELVYSTVEVEFRLSATGLSMFWPYLVVPVSFALQAVRLADRYRRGRPEPDNV
jgi:TRAP-type C4-dicarboxylate transport system permease small subunit